MSMTIEGIPVLLLQPQPPDEWPEAVRVPTARAETAGGNVVTGTPEDRYPTTTHQWRYVCPDRATLAGVEAFLHARQGAFAPFWLPVLRREVQLVSVGHGQVTVRDAGYGDHVRPDPSQQWVFFYGTGTRREAWKIYAGLTTDNGDGTHTWQVPSNDQEILGSGSITTASMVAQLVPARVAEEGWAVEFRTPTTAILTVSFVELQEELT